ncbi:MAG: hypothetical protein WDO13_09505 [Verrucomicrobiota bacterium]
MILRTRRQAFREALPEILGAVRAIARANDALAEERRRGADRMIRDYRAIIARLAAGPAARRRTTRIL